jgi:hypothetical protein
VGTDPAGANPNHDTVAGVMGVAEHLLKVYVCPSDRDMEVFNYQAGTTDFYESTNLRRSSYLFNSGGSTDYNDNWTTLGPYYRGAFGNNGAAKLADYVDGTSNTIAVGESKVLKTYTYVFGAYWGAGTHTAVHGYTGGPWDPRFTPNYKFDTCYNTIDRKCQYAWGFGSNHPNVTLFVMGDGSVQTIQDSILHGLFFRMATPDGGEAIVLPQ